jgi:hypothetical protein
MPSSLIMKTFLLCIFFIPTLLAGEPQVKLWQSYFPNMDCSSNECGNELPLKALEQMLEKASYLQPEKLKNTKWAFLLDFSIHSSEKRGFLIDLRTGGSESFHVSHGIGSADGEGNAIRFSNTNMSKMSSLGLYLTAETYHGKHGYSLRMDGLEESNNAARKRLIVVHAADYVSEEFIRDNGRAGRSWGCPAVAEEHRDRIINNLKDGSLYYIYHQ